MKHLFCYLLSMCCGFALSQETKDTSYSIMTEYKKQVKKFPLIEIVGPKPNPKVKEQYDLVYHSGLNGNLHLDAYLFQSTEKLPAVLLIHGGGWKSGNKSLMQPLAQQIALAGYHCFAIEYRLSDEAIYPAAIDDVVNAINFIKNNAAKFIIEVDDIAILGCSSGGQIASLIGTKYGLGIKAIVNLDGILAFHHPQSQEGKLASQWLGGSYDEKPEIWNEASALNHVTKNTPPFLFINSQHERFHAGRDEMITKMKGFNIYSKVETIQDSPHTFWLFYPWFKTTVNYILTFLDEKLKS